MKNPQQPGIALGCEALQQSARTSSSHSIVISVIFGFSQASMALSPRVAFV